MAQFRKLFQTVEKGRERFFPAEFQDLIIEVDDNTGEDRDHKERIDCNNHGNKLCQQRMYDDIAETGG